MPRPKNEQLKELANDAEDALERLDDGAICMRLIAIIQASSRSIESVAEDFQVSSRTIFRWINNFKDEGIDGLRGGMNGQRRSNLSEEQKQLVEKWVNEGLDPYGQPTEWTLESLRQAIKTHLDVSITLMPLWLMLQKRNCKIRKREKAEN